MNGLLSMIGMQAELDYLIGDFPEDMSESNTLCELILEGDNMYDALKEAVELISDLADELEYKEAVEEWS